MKKTYKLPELKIYGNAKAITNAQNNNKIGNARDAFTGLTSLIGDLVSCGPCTRG